MADNAQTEKLQPAEAPDSTNTFDPLITSKPAEVKFIAGNFDRIADLASSIAQKSTTISKTVIPLIQVALIELLGSSSAYTNDFFNAEFDADKAQYNVSTQFSVGLWLGTDVPTEAIASDSKYVLDRINVVPDVVYTRCEIDCTKGMLFVDFTI